MAGWRPPYTLTEDRKIIRFIVDNDHGGIVKGDRLWKDMEERKIVVDRTWHSMKNRWSKTIAPDIGRPEYGLTGEEKATLRAKMGLKVFSKQPVACDLVNQEKERLKESLKKHKGEHQKQSQVQKEVNKEPEQLPHGDQEFYSLDISSSDDSE